VRSWGLSAAEQDQVWARWRQGASLRLIARRLGNAGRRYEPLCSRPAACNSTTPPRAAVSEHGGREEISRGIAAGESYRQIAARLERAPSTVSRELARNGGRHRYRAQARP
jgi:DNA-binding CsgD family transcriptional regulator